MRRTELLQEVRKVRFEEACGGWQERRMTQEEAARMPGGARVRDRSARTGRDTVSPTDQPESAAHARRIRVHASSSRSVASA